MLPLRRYTALSNHVYLILFFLLNSAFGNQIKRAEKMFETGPDFFLLQKLMGWVKSVIQCIAETIGMLVSSYGYN